MRRLHAWARDALHPPRVFNKMGSTRVIRWAPYQFFHAKNCMKGTDTQFSLKHMDGHPESMKESAKGRFFEKCTTKMEYVIYLYTVLYSQNLCTKTCLKSALHKSHECYIYTLLSRIKSVARTQVKTVH